MPKWPFKWLSKEPPSEPATEKTTEEFLRRIEEARKSDALDLANYNLNSTRVRRLRQHLAK